MQFGLRIDDFGWPGGPAAMAAHLANAARRAEDAGFEAIWMWDHFVQLRRWEDPILEGWLGLAHIAAVTTRVRLGTHVTGVTHRPSAILVKMATTLDVLSGGRAYLGIGAGWNDREHAAFGVPFPPLGERFEILEETLQLALRAWSGETGPFEGRHVHLAEQIDAPRPIQQPHPKILIGGVGERKTLRLVARYAQATDMWLSDPDQLRAKLDVLRRHCEEAGRSYADVERHARIDLTPVGRSTDDIAPPAVLLERVRAMADAGADAIVVPLPRLWEPDVIERFGEEIVGPARGIVRPPDA